MGYGRRCVKIEHEHREQAEHVNKPMIRKKMLGNQGALLTLVLENNSSEDDVAFDNIVVAEPDMTTHKVFSKINGV